MPEVSQRMRSLSGLLGGVNLVIRLPRFLGCGLKRPANSTTFAGLIWERRNSQKNLKFPQLHDIVVDMAAGSVLPASVEFGRFRVLPYRRELLADGRPTKLGGRAFDILVALIEAREAVLSKDALMERVWPGRIVEENNLQAHISVLRAALGPDRDVIRTVFGRGYQFIGELRASPEIGDERAIRGPEEAESGALA